MKKFLFALFSAVTVSACSSGLLRSDGPRLDYINYAGDPVSDIVVMRGIDSWTPVSRDQLVIWTGINEAYLLRVWDTCRISRSPTRSKSRRRGTRSTSSRR